MRKKKILVMTDSARVYTGFANIGRHVAGYLHDTGRWDVHYLGWFDEGSNEAIAQTPYPLYHTIKDDKGRRLPQDSYGFISFPKIVEHVKPDIVLSIGDSLAGDRFTVIKEQQSNIVRVESLEALWDWLALAKQTVEAEHGREILEVDGSVLALTVVNGEVCWKPIQYMTRHPYEGLLTRVIQNRGTTVCTRNHSLIDEDGVEVRPEDISKPLYQLGNVPKTLGLDSIDLMDWLFDGKQNEVSGQVEFDEEYLWCRNANWIKCKRILHGNELEGFCRLLGAYISEGSASHHERDDGKGDNWRVRITCSDTEWLSKIQLLYHSIFSNYSSSVQPREWCSNLVVWGRLPFFIFTKLCGRGSYDKKLPQFIYNLEERYINALLEEYEAGDGYLNTPFKRDVCTTSEELMSGLCVLYSIFGEIPSIKYRHNLKTDCRSWNIRSITEHRKPPKTKTFDVDYSGYVYDLTVEDSHTFVDAAGPILVHNTWMTCHHLWSHQDKDTRSHIATNYTPVDHDPIVRVTRHMMGPQGSFDLDWATAFKRFDSVVGYCKYGMDEINKLCGEDVCTKFIYHGVDREIWKPLPQEERLRLRKEIFGMGSNDFLIISVGRNQPRKLYPVMAEALKIFIDQYEGGRPVYHYYHTPLQDPVGWNLQEILHVAGVSHRLLKEPHHVGRRVILNDQLGVGVGPTDEELNQLVNCADLFLMAHSGEGWGLPILEAMAAGVPTVSTGYSAPTDWAKGASHFIPVAQVYPEPQTGFRRAWVLPQDIANTINAVYSDKDYRRQLKKKGLEVAERCDWSQRILPEWEEYLDSLPLRKMEREIIYLRDADKLEVKKDGEATEQREAPLISVIVPTHVGGTMLKQCIDSLMAAGYPRLDTIVVDNGAWDPQTKPVIKELRSRGIRILEWNKKYSPSRVLNMAAREARGDFLLFLDNDTAMQPGAIHAMVNCFNERGCGISSVRLVHPDGQQFSTGMDYDYRLGFVPSRTGEGVVKKAAVTGSCMMIPSVLFRQLGGFDEGFRLFWQDADLCIRALAAGYHTLVNLNASCMHIGGVSRRYVSRSTNLADSAYLRRKHWPEYMPAAGSDEKENVVIIKLLTMGDAILITPMLPEIRKKHPNSRITLYTLSEYKDIFTHNPYIDTLKTVGPLNRDEFGPSWSLFAYDAIIENILSTTEWDYVYPCNQLDFWMEYRRAGTTMARTYQDMFDLQVGDQRYQLYSDEMDRDAVDDLIAGYPGDGPIVVMHTTAGWPLKEWTKEGWKELAKRLYDEYQARIFVVGGPNETLDSTYVRNVGGKLSLTQIGVLIAKSDLFIGGDSGPLHLAKAAPWMRAAEDVNSYSHGGSSTAILALFGCTNPMVVGFDEVPNYITLQSHYAGVVNCGFPECPMEKIAKDNDKEFLHCSKRIDIEHVWKAARKLLNRGEYSVREHWKGADPCSISFTEWEWVVRRLSGEDPPDMCPYGKDLVPEEAWK